MSSYTTTTSLAVVLSALSGLCILLRILSRQFIVKLVRTDDCLICLSWAASVALTVAVSKEGQDAGDDTSDMADDQLHYLLSRTWSSSITYSAAVVLLKDSILSQYLHLSPSVGFRRACWTIGTMVTLHGVSVWFTSIFSCRPIAYSWNSEIKDGKCINIVAFWFFNGTFNSISNVIVWALPLPVVEALRLHGKQLFGLGCVFVLGFLVIIASIVRLTVLSSALDDLTPHAHIATWSVIEVNMAIICACLPSMRHPITRSWLRFQAFKRRRSGPSFKVKAVRLLDAPEPTNGASTEKAVFSAAQTRRSVESDDTFDSSPAATHQFLDSRPNNAHLKISRTPPSSHSPALSTSSSNYSVSAALSSHPPEPFTPAASNEELPATRFGALARDKDLPAVPARVVSVRFVTPRKPSTDLEKALPVVPSDQGAASPQQVLTPATSSTDHWLHSLPQPDQEPPSTPTTPRTVSDTATISSFPWSEFPTPHSPPRTTRVTGPREQQQRHPQAAIHLESYARLTRPTFTREIGGPRALPNAYDPDKYRYHNKRRGMRPQSLEGISITWEEIGVGRADIKPGMGGRQIREDEAEQVLGSARRRRRQRRRSSSVAGLGLDDPGLSPVKRPGGPRQMQ